MDTSGLYETSNWVLANGYLIMFLAMLVEGPAVTAAGAFVAALGFFNVWVVLLLSVLGNIVPDIIYYAIGFWGRLRLVDKYGHYFGLTKERTENIEKLIAKHAGKSLIAIKLVPLLATPGLVIAGASRMPLRKYTIWSLAIILPTSLFFLIIGYYFGAAYNTIHKYLNYSSYLIVAVVAIFVVISYLWKRFSKKIADRIEKI